MQKEKRFWDTLKDIFVGAEIEGDSGFVNLMRIKRAYFSGVFKELERVVNEGTTDYPDFKEELFDKLYSFFKRYFSESGSIYFTYTPLKEQVYEKVYTNVDDVTLFWKTHMLYYVKTDQLWRNLTVKVQDSERMEWNILFDVSEMQHKQANERRRLVFDLSEFDVTGKRIVLKVQYAKSGRKTKAGQIAKVLAKDDIALNEEAIAQAISMFLRQNEVDFFINKDAEGFLKEQFDLWLFKDYLMDMTSVFDETRLVQIKFVRTIAYKVIEFVAKFEEELKKVWNKPKAVLNSNYVITLDRLLSFEGGMELLERILKDDGIAKQVEEWNELAVVDDDFTIASLFIVNVHGERDISENRKFLCIDTKHYDEGVKEGLLQLIKNHDEELDGWIIHSENYQALNTVLSRLESRVSLIYIDPPYNLEKDDFNYKDRFKHSSWITMMDNRLSLARDLLSDNGVLFVSIDDSEHSKLVELLKLIFGKDNFVNNVIWQKKFSPQNDAKWLSDNHDFLVCVARNKSNWRPTLLPRTEKQDSRYTNPDNDPRGPWSSGGLDVKTYSSEYDYEIVTPSGRVVTPPKSRCWSYPRERFEELVRDNKIWFGKDGNNVPRLKRFLSEVKQGVTPLTIWTHKEVGHNQEATQELKGMFSNPELIFSSPKPVRLLERVIHIGTATDNESIVLDYFAGSGTTAHAVMKLNSKDGGNRKFILVELEQYVHTFILPRIKKAAFSNNWRNGKPQENNGSSIFFKYLALESYEGSLQKAIYKESDPLQYESIDSVDMIHSYLFLDDRKLLDAVNVECDSLGIDLKKVYPDIDIAETLANLRGKMIKRIDGNGVEFEDGEYISFNELKFTQVRELIWW